MRITKVAASILPILSLASALLVTPSSEPLDIRGVSIEERSIVSSLVNEAEDFISNLSLESVAGTINKLLVDDGFVEILDNVLEDVANTHIVPRVLLYLISNNYTKEFTGWVLKESLKILNSSNSTAIFVALDRSGLAYSLVASTIEDPDAFPAVLSIAKKVIKSGLRNIDDIFSSGNTTQKRDNIFPHEGIYDLADVSKRDNVDDLLTTIFGSVAKSGIINDTVHELITSEVFQDELVTIIDGSIDNFNLKSTIEGLSAYKPLLTSLLDSGLLKNTLEEALLDSNLRSALGDDLKDLFKRDFIIEEDVLGNELRRGRKF